MKMNGIKYPFMKNTVINLNNIIILTMCLLANVNTSYSKNHRNTIFN